MREYISERSLFVMSLNTSKCLTFVIVCALWRRWSHLCFFLLLTLLLCQVSVGVMVAQTRPVLVALSTDYTQNNTNALDSCKTLNTEGCEHQFKTQISVRLLL